jgi:hypothetical protein
MTESVPNQLDIVPKWFLSSDDILSRTLLPLVNPPATVEFMSSAKKAHVKTVDVVEGLHRPQGFGNIRRFISVSYSVFAASAFMWITWLACIIASVISLIAVAWLTPVSRADDATPSASSSAVASSDTNSITVTNNITDTQNLLGDNVAAVNDAITKTQKDTGVDVRLLYLSSFGDSVKPEQWAKDVLESTNPKPNTVLLAIASNDGNLVVAISSNSDEWLKNKDTADQLSSAALKPLREGDTPDWSGSALALMQSLNTLKQTSTTSGTTRVGVMVMVAVLVAMVLIAIIVVVLRRRIATGKRRVGRHDKRKSLQRPPSQKSFVSHGYGSEKTGGELLSSDVSNLPADAAIESNDEGASDDEQTYGDTISTPSASGDMNDSSLAPYEATASVNTALAQDAENVQEISSTESEANKYE